MTRTGHATTKYIVTDHAAKRFRERVSSKGAHSTAFKKRVSEWVETAMAHSKKLGNYPDGTELYRFTDYVLVFNGSTLITIKPHESAASYVPGVEETIKSTIKKQVMRMLRPYLTRQQELLIEIHTQELKKLRVHNPETQQIIDGRISDLYEQLEMVKRQINTFSSIAYKHGVKMEVE